MSGGRPLRLPGSHAWLVVVPAIVAAAVSVVVVALAGFTPDGRLFARAGRIMVSADVLSAFESSQVQVGPLYLAIAGLVSRGGRLFGVPDAFSASAVIPAAAVALLALLRCSRGADRAAGALAVSLAGPVSVLAIEAHFEELLVAVALMAVAHASRGDRPVLAGILLAAAGGLKLWGLLGVSVLLLLPSLRQAARAALTAGVATALIYGPFIMFGDVRTFDHVWPVSTESPAALVIRGETFGWSDRALQTAFVIVLASLLTLRWRARPGQCWTVPLVVTCLRIVSDPLALAYYWAPPAALVLMGIWLTRAPVTDRVQATVVIMVLLCVMILTAGVSHLVAMLLAALGATAFAERNRPDRLAIPTLDISSPGAR